MELTFHNKSAFPRSLTEYVLCRTLAWTWARAERVRYLPEVVTRAMGQKALVSWPPGGVFRYRGE